MVILGFFDKQKTTFAENFVLLFARDAISFGGRNDTLFFLFVVFVVFIGRRESLLQDRVQVCLNLVILVFVLFILG